MKSNTISKRHMTDRHSRPKSARIAANKRASNMPDSDAVTAGDNGRADGKSKDRWDEVLEKINEAHLRYRQLDKETNVKAINDITDRLNQMQLNMSKPQTLVRTPMPKYSGKPGEFDDWREATLNCIKANDWSDEKRIIEILPTSLSGQAQRIFASLTTAQKSSLDSVFTALKESLEPSCKAYNRELFIKAKRNPGESMRFMSGEQMTSVIYPRALGPPHSLSRKSMLI